MATIGIIYIRRHKSGRNGTLHPQLNRRSACLGCPRECLGGHLCTVSPSPRPRAAVILLRIGTGGTAAPKWTTSRAPPPTARRRSPRSPPRRPPSRRRPRSRSRARGTAGPRPSGRSPRRPPVRTPYLAQLLMSQGLARLDDAVETALRANIDADRTALASVVTAAATATGDGLQALASRLRGVRPEGYNTVVNQARQVARLQAAVAASAAEPPLPRTPSDAGRDQRRRGGPARRVGRRAGDVRRSTTRAELLAAQRDLSPRGSGRRRGGPLERWRRPSPKLEQATGRRRPSRGPCLRPRR